MLCRILARLRRMPAAVVSAAALVVMAGGCSYNSEYVAPRDGRARPVWNANNVVVEMSGAPLTRECADEMLGITSSNRLRLSTGTVPGRTTEGYWVPIYYGPPIVVIAPGLAPVLPRPPLFLPSLVAGPVFGPRLAPSFGLGGMSLGGGGGGGDAGKILVVLAVIALLVLPAVDVGLALARPESPTKSSQAIDQVNAFNDLARSLGSPCSYAAAGGAQ